MVAVAGFKISCYDINFRIKPYLTSCQEKDLFYPRYKELPALLVAEGVRASH